MTWRVYFLQIHNLNDVCNFPLLSLFDDRLIFLMYIFYSNYIYIIIEQRTSWMLTSSFYIVHRNMPSTRNLRNLNLCFSNSTLESKSPPTSPISTTISEASSHQHHHHQIHHKPSSSTLSSSPSTMIKNFNSLYDPSLTSDHTLCSSSLSTTFTTSTSFELEVEPEPEPADFAAAFASQRFFFSSPGSSNSLIEYTNTDCIQHSSVPLLDKPNSTKREKKQEKEKEEVLFNGSVAVPTYSPDPYMDFRRSMQEMVEARPELMDVKSNWNILHELLLCYLALNPKNTHKFILGAFADLLVTLMSF